MHPTLTRTTAQRPPDARGRGSRRPSPERRTLDVAAPAAATSPTGVLGPARSRPSRTTSRRCASTSSRSSANRPLDEIDVPLVEAFIYAKLDEGKAPKSIRNYLGLLHSIFDHGVKRGWCESNPVALVEKPRARPRSRHPLPHPRRARGVLAASPDDAARPDRPPRLPDRGDDRDAPRRGRRPPLAGHRLARPADPRPPQLHPRRVRHAEVTPLEPRRPARRPARRRARAHYERTVATQATPTSSSPTPNSAASSTPRSSASASSPALRRAGRAAGPLPRPAPHLRHPDGRRRRAAAGDPGVAGPLRLPHDADLRRLRPRPESGRPLRRASLRSRRRLTRLGRRIRSSSDSEAGRRSPMSVLSRGRRACGGLLDCSQAPTHLS